LIHDISTEKPIQTLNQTASELANSTKQKGKTENIVIYLKIMAMLGTSAEESLSELGA
jgi:hypothetical protein